MAENLLKAGRSRHDLRHQRPCGERLAGSRREVGAVAGLDFGARLQRVDAVADLSLSIRTTSSGLPSTCFSSIFGTASKASSDSFFSASRSFR
jgi:hypothetical protein